MSENSNKKDVYDFSDFIGQSSLSTLASCSTIVGVVVQFTKDLLPIHPLGLSFIFSAILSVIKIVLSNDYSKNNVLLGIVNTIPMALTASGGYDLITKISLK